MRKHKKISWLTELQHKLDTKFGKGLYHAGFVLALVGCLSLTSCQPDGKVSNTTTQTKPTTERETPRTPAPKIIIEKTGQTTSTNKQPTNADFPEGSCVVDAYFARKNEDSGEYEKIKSSALGEVVYVVVDTIDLVGKEISLSILDKNKILTEQEYEKLSFLKSKEKSDTTLKEKVREDGLAIFEITLKPSNDDKEEKQLAEWRKKIGENKEKKLKLSLKVTAEGTNIIYCGTNPEGQTDGSSEKNYWLDTNVKAFLVRRKNPVIVIDPGHGYTKGNTGAVSWLYTYKNKGKPSENLVSNVLNLPQYVIDNPNEWIVSAKEDPNLSERFLVYDVSAKLKELLSKKGYKIIITRERGPLSGSDNGETRKKRIDMAIDNNADYFISIHADGLDGYTATGSHVIYPKVDNTESIALGKDIFSSYNIVTIDKISPKIDVRGLQLLSEQNPIKRKVLVELGFVTSPKDAKALFSNINNIAEQLFTGLEVNINKNY